MSYSGDDRPEVRWEERLTMSKSRYVALLRGINVGGNNIIKMVDLKASFEAAGFSDVATYIQSGNVLFTAKSSRKSTVSKAIEAALSKAFDYSQPVVLVSAKELELIVSEAPLGFGKEPDVYRYDVVFVKEPLSPAEVLAQVPTKPDVDTAHAGQHAVYLRKSIAKATQSQFPKLAQKPVYRSITIRNWNTTMKLSAMVSA
jgi:uncharacterized protein (DUF1697 family)